MISLFRQLDRLLRGEFTQSQSLRDGRVDVPVRRLVIAGLVCGAVYGLCMAVYAATGGVERGWLQFVSSSVKVPMLFLLTLLVTFPSLYAFGALAGSRLGLGDMLRLLVAAVTVNLAVVASFGPVTVFTTVFTTSYAFISLLNVVFFVISGAVSLGFLSRAVTAVFSTSRVEEAEGSRRARAIFRVWVVIYGVVGCQMGGPVVSGARSTLTTVWARLARLAWGDLLRADGDFALGAGPLPWPRLALTVLLGGSVYGAAMGSFAGAEASLYAALKVPLLLAGALLVCLPNFYVVNAVLGLADDFGPACRGVLSAQASVAVVLASLAPVTAFVSLSSSEYHGAKLLNVGVFLLGSLAAQRTLARHYRPLLAANRRHRVALLIWPALYLFVTAQLACALRPFVGHPDFPTEFVRDDWMGNVYIDLYWAVRGVLG